MHTARFRRLSQSFPPAGIDILTVAQCKHTDQARAWNEADVNSFAHCVEATQCIWLHAEPWDDPSALKRVWYCPEPLHEASRH